MDISSVNSDLIRGNVTTIILGCLLKDDKYGYEIMKDIEERSAGHYVLKQATLYNQLKRLEKQGLISSYDGNPDETGGGQRRYYTLTFEGRNFLLRERSEYEYSRTILDKLVSSKEFDFSAPVPFDASELRPYSKREPSEQKTVYRDKIVEVEKLVQVEKKVYVDLSGNEISEEDVEKLKEAQPSPADDEALKQKDEEIASLDEKIAALEEEVSTLRQQLEEAPEHTVVEYADTQYAEELKNELEDIKTQLAATERERDALAVRLAKLRSSAENTSEEELAAKQAELDELKSKQSALVMKLLNMQEDYERVISEHKAREEELEKELEQLRQLRSDREEEERRKQRAAILDRLNNEESENKDDLAEISSIIIEDDKEEQPKSRASMSDLLERLDRKESEIDAKASEKKEEQPAQEVAADVAEAQQAPSAVVHRGDEPFAYEQDNVNYQSFYYSVSEPQPVFEEEKQPDRYEPSDIKKRLYSKGFKVRPYSRSNTSEFYTLKFVHNNRLNRDTFLIVLGLFLLEMAIMWLSLMTRISYKYFLPILLIGSALCLIPTAIYLADPLKRVRANFNFKLSILNRSMMFIELTVVCILIGFFALGASVKDVDLILCSIVIPAVIFFNLPISSVIYGLLYRTQRYHTA